MQAIDEIKKAIRAVQTICADQHWSEWADNWLPGDESGAISAAIMADRASYVKVDGQWRRRVDMALASNVAGVAATLAAASTRYCHTVHPSYPKNQTYFVAMGGIARRCRSIVERASELDSENPRLYHGETFKDKLGPSNVGARIR